VSDIITACHQKDKHRYISFYNDEEGSAEKIKFNDDWESEFFVRLTVKDKPEFLPKLPDALANTE